MPILNTGVRATGDKRTSPPLKKLVEHSRSRHQYWQRGRDLLLEQPVMPSFLAKAKRPRLECILQPRDPIRFRDCIHGHCSLDVRHLPRSLIKPGLVECGLCLVDRVAELPAQLCRGGNSFLHFRIRTLAAHAVSSRRPRDAFRPNSPQWEAGMRIEPPPSVPYASGTIPAATHAAEPPLEPPGL
jgi:hypothetical protein